MLCSPYIYIYIYIYSHNVFWLFSQVVQTLYKFEFILKNVNFFIYLQHWKILTFQSRFFEFILNFLFNFFHVLEPYSWKILPFFLQLCKILTRFSRLYDFILKNFHFCSWIYNLIFITFWLISHKSVFLLVFHLPEVLQQCFDLFSMYKTSSYPFFFYLFKKSPWCC